MLYLLYSPRPVTLYPLIVILILFIFVRLKFMLSSTYSNSMLKMKKIGNTNSNSCMDITIVLVSYNLVSRRLYVRQKLIQFDTYEIRL